MSDIRVTIMSRKLQRSTTRCWSCGPGKGSLPSVVSCRRLSVLIGGRLYHRWLCAHCIGSIWGMAVPQRPLRGRQTPASPVARRQLPEQHGEVPVTSPSSPVAVRPHSLFGKGQYIGQMLLEEGVFDAGMLTTHAAVCQQEARLYAHYAAPAASEEDVRTIAAGILYLWASGCSYGRQA